MLGARVATDGLVVDGGSRHVGGTQTEGVVLPPEVVEDRVAGGEGRPVIVAGRPRLGGDETHGKKDSEAHAEGAARRHWRRLVHDVIPSDPFGRDDIHSHGARQATQILQGRTWA